jgi:hypothetical protein
VPLKDVRPASRRGPRELTGAVEAVDLCGVWAVCDALDPRSNSSDKVLGDNDPAPYTLSTARMGEGAMQAYKAISIRSSLGDSLCTAQGRGGGTVADRVLVVEDDEALGGQIVDRLRREGYEVVWWREGHHVHPDAPLDFALVVLDLMSPRVPGLTVLEELRASSDVPAFYEHRPAAAQGGGLRP